MPVCVCLSEEFPHDDKGPTIRGAKWSRQKSPTSEIRQNKTPPTSASPAPRSPLQSPPTSSPHRPPHPARAPPPPRDPGRDVAQLRLAGPLQGQGLRLQAPLHGIGTPDPPHPAQFDLVHRGFGGFPLFGWTGLFGNGNLPIFRVVFGLYYRGALGWFGSENVGGD